MNILIITCDSYENRFLLSDYLFLYMFIQILIWEMSHILLLVAGMLLWLMAIVIWLTSSADLRGLFKARVIAPLYNEGNWGSEW